MLRSLLPALALVLTACGAARNPDPKEPTPGLVFPAHFAEGENQPDKEVKAHPKPAQPPPPEPKGSQPDPEPLRQAQQYEFVVAYDQGKVSVASVQPLTFPQPVVTARRMGRFAIELWIGRELIERVRFDFPLTGADDPKGDGPQPLAAPPNLGSGVSAKQKVLVPAAARARRALLVDRATGEAKDIPWPPDRPPEPAAPPP